MIGKTLHRNFLVVAGNGATRDALGGKLRQKGFAVTLAASGVEALRVVRTVSVDAVLIESHLPDIGAEQLRAQLLEVRPDCRVITLTSLGAARGTPELLRFGPDDFLLRGDRLLEIIGSSFEEGSGAGGSIAEKAKKSLLEVIDVLVGLLELEDRFFGGGSHQAMRLAREVAEEMGVETETLEEVVLSTLLRDIGKSGVDGTILANEKTFAHEQMDQMKEHVSGSLRLLEHIDFPWKIRPVIRHHHERYDGKGYPDGLRGREIPLGARIVAAVDGYIAMISDRPHRPAIAHDEAQAELVLSAGTQFDPEVIEVLLRVLDKRNAGRGSVCKPQVLIAEPQEEFRNLLKMRLLNEGFEVEAVENAGEVLDRILVSPPDLVIADVSNEGSDAFQLLREIREDESLRHIPFAFLSTKEDRIMKVRALRQGVDDFLSKSSDIEELVARIENILTRESARRDGRTKRRRGIVGQLENMPFPEIVQTLSIGMKTACVSLSEGKAKGAIWFEEGMIKHARILAPKDQVSEGEAAFFAMVRWTKGEFAIEHGVKAKVGSISQDAMYLLMEAYRLIDEESDAPPQLAAVSKSLALQSK